MIRSICWLTAILSLTAALPARAEPTTLGRFNDWTAFRADQGGETVCYIGSVPLKEEGDYTARGKTYVLVALRPPSRTGVVSVEAGYPYANGSRVNVTIDGTERFELFTDNRDADGNGTAWAEHPAPGVPEDTTQDAALVAAMKAGGTMVVQGRSSRGTLTTDTYSLRGFTRALREIEAACAR